MVAPLALCTLIGYMHGLLRCDASQVDTPLDPCPESQVPDLSGIVREGFDVEGNESVVVMVSS